MPKKPNTTDGMPASTSIMGLTISRSQRGETSATNTAASSPVGAASTAAPTVTRTDPNISGHSPKKPSVGYQRVPNSTFALTSKKAGAPSRARNAKMSRMKAIVLKPDVRMRVSRSDFADVSFASCGLLVIGFYLLESKGTKPSLVTIS